MAWKEYSTLVRLGVHTHNRLVFSIANSQIGCTSYENKHTPFSSGSPKATYAGRSCPTSFQQPFSQGKYERSMEQRFKNWSWLPSHT